MADMFTARFHVRRFLINLLNVTSLKMVNPCYTYFKAPERRNADSDECVSVLLILYLDVIMLWKFVSLFNKSSGQTVL